MQHDRNNWAAYNAGVTGRECEGSVWLGALHHTLPSGAPVDVDRVRVSAEVLSSAASATAPFTTSRRVKVEHVVERSLIAAMSVSRRWWMMWP